MTRNFNLSGLLRLRRLQETKAAGELSNANRQVQRRRIEHEAMRQELAGDENYPVDSDTLLALMASRAATRAGLRDMEAMLAADQAEVLAASQAHQTARAEVKALEKLEHRHVTGLRAKDLAREQLLLDDLARTASNERSRT